MRRFAAGVGCVLFALLVGCPTTNAELLGVDVSRYQANVNWDAMRSDGVSFAFAKATEGVDFVDVYFAQNMTNARESGVPIGPYHFARPDSSEGTLADPVKQDAINEANDFVDAIAPYYENYPGAYLRPVLDVETLPSTAEINTVSEQREYLTDWIHDFNSVVQDRLGLDVIIYLNSNYANNYVDSSVAQYDLWMARWTYNTSSQPTASNLGYWDDWEFWQWSDSESIGGISPIDANLFRGDENDLQAFLVGADPALAADFNEDGVVDAADYAIWRTNWLQFGLPGDADGDGFVGNSDYEVWAETYGMALEATDPPIRSVPEPSSMVVVVAASLAAGFRCDRQRRSRPR